MDLLSYVLAVIILGLSIQFNALWISLAVLIFILISMRSLSGILLTLVTGGVFFFLGPGLQGDMLWISAGLVAFAYFIGVKPGEEQAGGMDPNMLAALGGGGGEFGPEEFGGLGNEGFGGQF
jgi:hypothetical protein